MQEDGDGDTNDVVNGGVDGKINVGSGISDLSDGFDVVFSVTWCWSRHESL